MQLKIFMSLQTFLKQGAVGTSARFAIATTAIAASTISPLLQAQDHALSPMVVTASRLQQSLAQVTADITIIDQAEIERAGPVGVADVLARVPGVQLSRNGGLGQSTGVYIRGTSNQHAIVLIDGVRYGTQEMQGGAPWAHLPLGQIERIEVLRGPAAAVYGSDAIGGVIQIFTRKAQNGKASQYLEAGAGTHSTRKLAAGISKGTGNWHYALNMVDQRSDGFDVYPGNTWGANTDKDGYSNSSAGFNAGYRQGIHDFSVGLHHTRQRGHYDQSTPPFDDYDTNKTTLANVKWAAQWSKLYHSEVQLAQTRLHTERHTATAESLKANSTSLLWQNIWNIQGHQLNLNLERMEDRLDTDYAWTQNVDAKRTQNAIALGWNYTSGVHTLNTHIRHDAIRQQQSKTTGGVGYGLQLNEQWRWVASAGTAFRTPTLYERYTGQSAADLRPESSRNMETGLYFEQDTLKLSAVVFQNRIRDQITYDWTSAQPCNCYRNWEKVKLTGLTLTGETRWAHWNFSAALDLLNPKDEERNTLLPYRSKRALKLHANTQLAHWVLGGEAQLYSQRQTNTTNTRQLPGYGLINLYAERALTSELSLTARLDNIADKHYEPAAGYASAGRTVYFSLKWTPK